MKKARIINGVVDSISLEAEGDGWVDCPDDVFAGHSFDGSVFMAPPKGPPAPLPVDPLFEALDLIVAALNPAQQAAIIAKLDEARAKRGVA